MYVLKTFWPKIRFFAMSFLKAPLSKKLIILAIIFIAGWITISRIQNIRQQQPQYQTAQVAKGTLISSITASGTMAFGNSATISTGATGTVSNVYVQNGDNITAGQKIADITLDTESQQKQAAAWASYLSAQNSLNNAQAKLYSLQSTLFKANQVFVNDKGIANPSDQQKSDPRYIEENADWLQAESDYKNQTGVINQAQAAVTSAWLSYKQISSTITAPISGTITNLTISPGLSLVNTQTNSTSNNNSQTPQSIGTITTENGQLQAVVNVSEIDVVHITPGQKATLTLDAFPDKTFTGKVVSINTNGVVSSGVTTYPTTIVLDTNADRIYPNMAVSATIITNIKNEVLLVPTSAISTQGEQPTIRILKNGQVEQVDVEIGDSNDTQTEIRSGIKEGDTVITNITTTQSNPIQGSSSPFSSFGGGGARGFGGGGFVRGGGAGR